MNNQAAQTMPELPDSQYRGGNDVFGKEFPLYTADQMHQYARDYAAMLAAAPAASGVHPDALPDGTMSKSTVKRVTALAAASVSERARVLLATEYDKIGLNGAATYIRSGQHGELDKAIIRAIEQAMTQQRGEPFAWAMTDHQADGPMTILTTNRGNAKFWGEQGIDVEPLYTTPQPSADAVREGYYLASFKRSHDRGYVTWWMADNAGYTSDLNQAGIYTELTPGYHDSEYTVPVPVSFIDRLRVRRMVDVGDSDNRALWTANDLRAALANELESLLSAASGEGVERG